MANEFVNNILTGIDEVSCLEWLNDKVVHIFRDEKKSFTAGVLSKKRVSMADVSPLIGTGVSFVTNVPKAGLWLGEAITLANKVAWRGVDWAH